MTIEAPGREPELFYITKKYFEGASYGIRGSSKQGSRCIIFVAGDKIVTGHLYTKAGKYWLSRQGNEYQWIRSDVPGNQTFLGSNNDTLRPRGIPSSPPQTDSAGSTDAQGNALVDVLVLYTAAAQARIDADIGLVANANKELFVANSFFEVSLIPVRYRLAGVAKYDGTEEARSFEENLNVVAGDPDVAAFRNRVGADVVALIRTMDGTQDVCGMASAFNDHQRTDPPANVDPERDAFAVIGGVSSINGFVCDTSIFAHELGHVLGGGHAVPISLGNYWKSYAHGIVCGGSNDDTVYTSIMFGVSSNLYYAVGDFFSNPALLLNGEFCGSEGVSGAEMTQANNAKSIAEAARYVSAYRMPTAKSRLQDETAAGGGAMTTSGIFLFMIVFIRRFQS